MAEERKIGEGAGPRALARAVPPRETSAADRVRATEFPAALRGYDRDAVDDFVAQVAEMIDALESRQSRETVVQRALEEVGEETSAVLKQAHESADDITARSRSQAEDRVEVARQEAAAITHEASLEVADLKRDTQDLQDERATLIDELRRLATETLAIADAAGERLADSPMPEGVIEAPLEGSLEGPYDDGADDIDPAEEWPTEETGLPTEETGMPADKTDITSENTDAEDPSARTEDGDPPTEELRIPQGERREDEPPRFGG